MRKLNIEVQEESGRPGGGHAVIRLMGLQSLPDNVTYRIRPVDTALHSDGQGAWIESDRQPLATRITTEGAELVVGPEIVENPAFMPGTLAVIEVAKCGVRGEFLWPRIAPLVRPKRRHLITVKPQRAAAPEPASDIAFGEATDASSHIEPSAPTPVSTTDAAQPDDVTAIPDTSDPAPAGTTAEPDAALPVTEMSAATEAPASAAPIAPARTLEQTTPQRFAPPPVRPARTSGLNHTATVLAGLGIIGLSLYMLSGKPAPLPKPDKPVSLAALLSTGGPQTVTAGTSSSALSKLLEDADARLHGPETARNKTEAAGLLRRYLATTLGDERTLWALTQLGSVYAEPPTGNAPDYANARRLWELSGSLGDPVAMCFVAALREHGLGVQPDKTAALDWYRQSKAAGGCRDTDAAIHRLQPKK